MWLAGERVDDVASHPAFRATVEEFARLFDLRRASAANLDLTTYPLPQTGHRVSHAYSMPATAAELRRKYAASEWWMRESLGLLPPEAGTGIARYDAAHPYDSRWTNVGGNSTCRTGIDGSEIMASLS